MIRRGLTAVGLAMLLAVGLGGAPSQAQPPVDCSKVTTSNVVIVGDLVVSAGTACTLNHVTVTGSVDVQADADLFLDESTVGSSLTLRDNAFADVARSTVGAGTFLINAFGVAATSSTFASGVDVAGAVFFFSDLSNHVGTVVSRDGWTFIDSGQVAGGLFTVGDEATDLVETTVKGGMSVDKALDGSIICQSVVKGGVEVTGSSGVIQIGGDQPVPLCGENVIAGGLSLVGNSATDIQVSSNMITGGMECVDNVPVPSGSDNLIFGPVSGECGVLAEARSGGQPVAASPEERRAEIEVLINNRKSTF
jgi:hypothetical protein